MRLTNVYGRAAFVMRAPHEVVVDVADVSAGSLPADLPDVYTHWGSVTAWYTEHLDRVTAAAASAPRMSAAVLGPPSPAPGQVFAIGLNYSDHAAEAGVANPDEPVVFTKFPSCFTGPDSVVELPAGAHVDWEIEVVVVIGRSGRDIPIARAWQHVAGLTIGQDLSDRVRQARGTSPQFSLCKSSRGFGPQGPALVTFDELGDIRQLQLICQLNGEIVQNARAGGLIFPIEQLIHQLSVITELRPGDVIFTGTPGGTGLGRNPQRFLKPGDKLISRIPGIGELRQTFT
jgi:2,4-didehydro-3-deoxy-L-rhamnonate hydrolase